MKITFVISAAAILAVGACSKPDAASDGAPIATVNAAAVASATSASFPAAVRPASNPPAFVIGQPPSKAFLAGTWGMEGSCDLPIDFQPDGTIKDGPFDRWDLKDGQLVMQGAPQKMRLTVVDERTMTSQLEGFDKRSTLKRC